MIKNVVTTLFNVFTSYQRPYNVVVTSCASWVETTKQETDSPDKSQPIQKDFRLELMIIYYTNPIAFCVQTTDV